MVRSTDTVSWIRFAAARRRLAWSVCAIVLAWSAASPLHAQRNSPEVFEGFGLAGDHRVPPSSTDCYGSAPLDTDDPRPTLDSNFRVTGVGRVPHLGRLVVATANTGIQPPPVIIFYTDDEGENWERARGRLRAAVRVLAFERDGLHGVAAGTDGEISSTDDGGTSWNSHGLSAPGTCFATVLVYGYATVLVDQEGRIWRSRQGGAYRTLVVEDPDAVVRLRPIGIEIETEGRRYYVLPDGNLQPP